MAEIVTHIINVRVAKMAVRQMAGAELVKGSPIVEENDKPLPLSPPKIAAMRLHRGASA